MAVLLGEPGGQGDCGPDPPTSPPPDSSWAPLGSLEAGVSITALIYQTRRYL